VPSTNYLADRLEPQGVGSFFLYTHEAHPGEHYPHLTSMEQKFRHAKDLRDELGVTRPIQVDSLDGICQRACGSMPNMTWIFNRAGVVVYKSDWTDSTIVENAIEHFLDGGNRRKRGTRQAPFRVERMDFLTQDQAAF
jgi:hypothetical protein